jgi:hypothetical protein
MNAENVLLADQLESRIRDFLKLENDWDGFGGVPANQQTVNDVIGFLNKLPNEVSPAKLMLAGEGIIGLYWDNESNYIDVCFEGDGTFLYYARDGKGNEIGANDISLKTDIPKELLDMIIHIKTQ